MNLIETWLGDASSLWMSLGALIVIALLVVLMFNAFQGRSRKERWSSQSGATPGQATDMAAPAPSPQARVEPRFGAGTAPTQASSAVEPDDEIRPFATAGSDREEPSWNGPTTDEPAMSSGVGRGADTPSEAALPEEVRPYDSRLSPQMSEQERSPPRSRVTARRQSGSAGGIPLVAEWGGLDDRIDCIALLELQPPVDCIALRSGAQTLARIGSKSVIAEVQLADGHWCDVRAAEGLAGRLRLGILLANRQGPLSAAEFAEFAEKLRRLAGKLGVKEARLPETMGVLERARQVDEFCARLDTLIGVNVLAPERIPPAKVAELAQTLALVPRGHQRFARAAASGDVLFTMLQAERPEMLTFLLDVPRAPSAEQPWIRMVEAAHQCAQLLNGQLVDDALAPLSDAAAHAVARQLQSHYAQLDGAGLNAGSAAALRVFN